MATMRDCTTEDNATPRIAAQSLSKRFGDRAVLKGIDLEIGIGEIFGYLGPNGAGKTTTLRLLLGLLRPSEGSALIDGQNAYYSMDVRRRVGVLLEHCGLFDRLSAADSLAYYARLFQVPRAKERIGEMLELAGLTDRSRDKVGTYSQGMKRRLGLARALLHRPSILLLDEPSSGLDPEAQKMVRELIESLSKNEQITVFMNTHDLDDVQRICTRVAILFDGRIKADETLATWTRRSEASGLVFTFRGKEDVQRAVEILNQRLAVSSIDVEGATVTVWTEQELPTETVIDLMRSEGVPIHEVRRARQSLEDLYLKTIREESKHA